MLPGITPALIAGGPAFPVVAGVVTTKTSAGTTHTFNVPTHNPGDLLLAFIVGPNQSGVPVGWTGLEGGQTSMYRIATGNDPLVVGSSTVHEFVSVVYRIVNYSGVPFGTSIIPPIADIVSPSPPALTTPWREASTLWFAAVTWNYASAQAIIGIPANYINPQYVVPAPDPSQTAMHVAQRERRAETEDPGNYTLSAFSNPRARTVAVAGRGAGAWRSRSLRFNTPDAAMMTRTPGSSGNRDVLTFHCWLKRASFGVTQYILEAAQDANNRTSFSFDAAGQFRIRGLVGGAVNLTKFSSRLFRDPAAWFSITVQINTNTNTYRVWVDADEITAWSTDAVPAAGTDTFFNHTCTHYLGAWNGGGAGGDFFGGYMANVHMIDGLALDYNAFIVQDPATGVWGPKLYTGAYGTNGFKLDFANNGAATAAALGKDSSGMYNLLVYSDAFDHAYWNARNTFVYTGQTDPFGGTGACSFFVLYAATQPDLSGGLTVTTGQTYTATVYAKAGTAPLLQMNCGVPHGGFCYFDLVAGTINPNNYAPGQNTSASMTPVTYPLGGGKTAVSFLGIGGPYLRSAAPMTGAADSKLFSFSLWVRRASNEIGGRIVTNATTLAGADTGTTRLVFSADPAFPSAVTFTASDPVGGVPINMTCSVSPVVGQWEHYCGMVDTADAAKCKMYRNGVDVTAHLIAPINSLIDFTYADWAIGARPDGSGRLPADLAEVWYAPGQWVDFRVQANREKFALSVPVDLGAAGATPTGTSPLIFLSGSPATWHVNKGSGGGFIAGSQVSEARQWWKCSITTTMQSPAGSTGLGIYIAGDSVAAGTGDLYIFRASMVTGSATPNELQYTAGAVITDKNWTPVNLSVVAGDTNDSLVDTPTIDGIDTGVGGELRGNYCTFNPLAYSAPTYADGNLKASSATDSACAQGTFAVTSGKWYFEAAKTADEMIGWGNIDSPLGPYPGSSANALSFHTSGSVYYNAASTAYGGTHGAATIGCALDLTNNRVYWSINGVWQNSANPAANTGGYALPASLQGVPLAPSFRVRSGSASENVIVNFGQRPFAYAAPSGFKSLCTANLPTPVIQKPSQYFDTHLRTNTVTGAYNVTGKLLKPDLVWAKARTPDGIYWSMYDSARGVRKELSHPGTGAEITNADGVTSFNADGYSAGAYMGISGQTWVDYLFKKDPVSGFDIVTYTGNGTAGRTVAHGLGVQPKFILVKRREVAGNDWNVWSKSVTDALGASYNIVFNTNAAAISADVQWSSTAPTAAVFTVGTAGGTNTAGGTYVAYLFAEVPGFSRIDKYIGNNNADGPFVWCGFRPRWLLVKNAVAANNWFIRDAARDPINPAAASLYPSTPGAESVSVAHIDFLSNGFKIRSTFNNEAGNTHIFAAFAEAPFKYARAR